MCGDNTIGQHEWSGHGSEIARPPLGRSGGVLRVEPRDVITVRANRRQSVDRSGRLIRSEQLGEEDGDRPTIHEYVMGGDDHPAMYATGHREKQDSYRRTLAQIKRTAAFRQRDVVEIRCPCLTLLPRDVRVRRHDLHRLGQPAIPECGAQIGMPCQERLRAAVQQIDVELSLDICNELHAVQVDALIGQLGKRKEALLQGT
ncbi:Uncharacterised protein [Mycobacteroides abscessus subsp. massiliense]|nr:Uncharacterised protein [Mycobacteroides abscessus subsp. massiliense]